jgi:hypothetical protein
MADMYIDFQFDLSTLTQDQRGKLPGTFANPVPVAHPPVRYRSSPSAPWTVLQNPDFPVPVAFDTRVLMTVSSPDPGSNYVMAPDRFLPITWTPDQGSKTDCNASLLNGSSSPIDTPQFDVDHPVNYTLAYQGPQGTWQPDPSGSIFGQYGIPGDCMNVSRQTQPSRPALFAPHVSFNVADLPGTLYYGLQIRIIALNTGENIGWVWWDPSIQVTANGGTSQFFRRKR